MTLSESIMTHVEALVDLLEDLEVEVSLNDARKVLLDNHENELKTKEEENEKTRLGILSQSEQLVKERESVMEKIVELRLTEEKIKHLQEDFNRRDTEISQRSDSIDLRERKSREKFELINKADDTLKLEQAKLDSERLLLDKEKAELHEKSIMLDGKEMALESKTKRVNSILGS